MRFARALVALSGFYLAASVSSIAAAPAPQGGGKSTQDGVYTDAQAKRGEAAYSTTCAGCHGPDLAGADTAPSLTGAEFNAGWTDQTVDDLFQRIKTTMPGDAPGSLSDAQCADILAFVLSKDGFPAGQTELTAGPGLKDVKFVVKK
jgi:mono/diheme cytochrome c family protein